MRMNLSPLVQGATEARRATPLVVAWIVTLGLVVGVLVVVMVVRAVGYVLLGLPLSDSPTSWLVVYFIDGVAVLGLLALWVTRWKGRSIASIGLPGRRWSLRLMSGFLAGAALFAIPALFLLLIGQLAEGRSESVTTTGLRALPMVLVAAPVWLVQAAVEECIFCGYLLQRHALRLPAWLAIGATSLGFTAIHLNFDPIAVINLMLFGVFLGFVAVAEGSLWTAIGLHAGWNLAQGSIFGIPVSGNEQSDSIFAIGPADGAATWLTGGSWGLEAGVAVMAVQVVACAVAYIPFRRACASRADTAEPAVAA